MDLLDHDYTKDYRSLIIPSTGDQCSQLMIIPMNDAYFVEKAYAEICDHSLFTLQFQYIEN